MDRNSKACTECARLCCLIHREKNESHSPNSFFKIMFGDSFSQILFLPPKFAQSIPSMAGRSANLEDSSGQLWEVTFQDFDGALVFQQGWSIFASDHNLHLGDLVLFFPMRESSHFVVKIYDRTSCEKSFFDNGVKERTIRKKSVKISKRKNRPWDTSSNDNDSSSDKFGLSASIGPGDMNEANAALKEEWFEDTSYMIGRDLGEKREEKRICDFDLSAFETRDALESRIPLLESSPIFQNDEWMVRDNDVAPMALCVITSGNNNDLGPENDDKTESVSDKGSSSLLAITPIENPRENVETLPNTETSEGNDRISRSPEHKELNGFSRSFNINIPQNDDKTECVSDKGSSILLAMTVEDPRENDETLPNAEIGGGNDPISRSPEHREVNSNIPNSIPTENRQCEDNPATLSHSSERTISEELNGNSTSTCNTEKLATENFIPGESSKSIKRELQQRVGRTVPERNTSRPVVVKTETINVDKYYKAAVNPIKFPPMLVTCNGQSYLELPSTLPFPVIEGRARGQGLKTVYLRDPTMKAWPVLYHETETTQLLNNGWEDLSLANRIKPGDQCLFTVENEAEGFYSIRIV